MTIIMFLILTTMLIATFGLSVAVFARARQKESWLDKIESERSDKAKYH